MFVELIRLTVTGVIWRSDWATGLDIHFTLSESDVLVARPGNRFSLSSDLRQQTLGQEPTAIELVDYEYVKKLPCEPQKLLVDVREPNELEESGQIPTSINIPLAQVCQELVASKQIFECNYGRKRPELDTEIIFHCRSGKRSLQAAEVAVALGFRNVKNYEGSWLDWAKNEGLSS